MPRALLAPHAAASCARRSANDLSNDRGKRRLRWDSWEKQNEEEENWRRETTVSSQLDSDV